MLNALDLLAGLKVDLGITSDAYNDRLIVYLETAQARLAEEGITLTSDTDDSLLVQQYAAWLWSKRDSGAAMPRMLRWQINNRLFSRKMR
jgi:hypothetical protein